MAVGVVTDSTAYLTSEQVRDQNVRVVSLRVNDAGTDQRELDIDREAFYARLANTTTLPTSSQPSPGEMREALEAALSEGDGQAVGVFISSKMSGTVESARLVADMIVAEDPDARIEIVDSGSNCMQLGFAALAAAQAAREGRPLAECATAAQEATRRTRFLFAPHTLEYLRRGGRIGNASALLGSLLQITPVLTVEDGMTTTATKVRTRSRALSEITSRFRDDVERCGLADVVVHSIADLPAARSFAAEHIEPVAGHEVPVVPIGPVIGLHVGPAVGVAYQTIEPLR